MIKVPKGYRDYLFPDDSEAFVRQITNKMHIFLEEKHIIIK